MIDAPTARLEAYENRTAPTMVGLAFGYLALFTVQVLVEPMAQPWSALLNAVGWLIWASFVTDLAIRTFLAPRKLKYLARHPIDVIACAVPALRGLQVLRVLTAGQWLVRRGSRLAIGRTASALILAVAFVSFVASLAVFDAERDAPDANIATFGDAIWWSFTTMSTVGYGDAYPVTLVGRVVAVSLMVVGVSILGIVSATLASTFIAVIRGEEESDTARIMAKLEAVQSELEELRRQPADSSSSTPRRA